METFMMFYCGFVVFFATVLSSVGIYLIASGNHHASRVTSYNDAWTIFNDGPKQLMMAQRGYISGDGDGNMETRATRTLFGESKHVHRVQKEKIFPDLSGLPTSTDGPVTAGISSIVLQSSSDVSTFPVLIDILPPGTPTSPPTSTTAPAPSSPFNSTTTTTTTTSAPPSTTAAGTIRTITARVAIPSTDGATVTTSVECVFKDGCEGSSMADKCRKRCSDDPAAASDAAKWTGGGVGGKGQFSYCSITVNQAASCMVVKEDENTKTIMLDTEFEGCVWPFKGSKVTSGAPSWSINPVRCRSTSPLSTPVMLIHRDDPWIKYGEITEGEYTFGIDRETQNAVGIAILCVGLIIGGCGVAGCCYAYRCNTANGNTVRERVGSMQHRAFNKQPTYNEYMTHVGEQQQHEQYEMLRSPGASGYPTATLVSRKNDAVNADLL